MKCLKCECAAKIRKLPGFISLRRDNESYICEIVINEKYHKIGAHTLGILYEAITKSFLPPERL